MPMNDKERFYIEYRPKLGYTVNIMAVVDSTGAAVGAMPKLPIELQEALASPASSVIKEGLNTVNEMDALLDVLEDKLAGVTIYPRSLNAESDTKKNPGLSFQDYLQAITNDDYETQDTWNDYHRDGMDGRLEAELYPLLLQSRDSLASAIEFLNELSFREADFKDPSEGSAFSGQNKKQPDTQHLSDLSAKLVGNYAEGVNVSSPTLVDPNANFRDLEAMVEKEANQLEAIVRGQIESGHTSPQVLSALKTKTQVVDIISELIDVKKEFTEGASNLVNESLEDAIGGDATSIVENLATMSEAAASGANSMLTIMHAIKADAMADLADRMIKLCGEPVRDIIQDEIIELSKLMNEAHESVAWMDSIDTNYDQASIVAVIEESLMGVDVVLQGYESALLDLFKMNNMEQIQSADILASLSSKNTTRKTYQVLADMRSHYTPGQQPSLAAKQFADNMGYSTNRVTKVKPKTLSNGSLDRNDRL